MKTLLLTLLILFAVHLKSVIAQPPSTDAIKQEMKRFAFMAGNWTGEATVKRGNTAPIKVLQEENIQFKLDGTVLFIEGIGRSPEAGNPIIFNAIGIISYNQYTKQFGMKSYTMEGNQTEAYFKVIDVNHYEWGFETPTKAKIKYDIILDEQAKTWTEKGDYSQDGTSWYPFIELKLNKVK